MTIVDRNEIKVDLISKRNEIKVNLSEKKINK